MAILLFSSGQSRKNKSPLKGNLEQVEGGLSVYY